MFQKAEMQLWGHNGHQAEELMWRHFSDVGFGSYSRESEDDQGE